MSVRFGTVFGVVTTFYSLLGWVGALVSLALCLLALWWIEH